MMESTPEQNKATVLEAFDTLCNKRGTRSGYESLTLAIPPSYGVPYRHGYAPIITTRPLGTDTTRSAGLYCRA